MYKEARWYRLLQVIYTLTLIGSLLAGVVWAYNQYHPRKAHLTFEEFEVLRSGGDFTPRIEGSWIEVILYSLGSSVVIIGIFLILRKLFFYIYEGESLFERDSTQRKKVVLDIARVTLYLFLALLFFFTWGLRKDLGITGFFSATIHFAIFWGLFLLTRKKARSDQDEIKEGATKGEKVALKVFLLFALLSLLVIALAPLFF